MSTLLPKIRIDFSLIGDDFDLDLITEKMQIIPTNTRRKEECPVASMAITYWCLSTNKETCKAVSYSLNALIEKLKGKEVIIKELCNENNLEVSFNVVVEMEVGDGPEFVLTKEIITFASLLNAEICFDLYID